MNKLETPLTDADAIIYKHDPSAKWIWQANEGACKKCTDLDGQKFSYNDVPPRPHPNCKCAVVPILSASAASQPQTQSPGRNVLRETLLEIGAYVQDYLKDRGDLARQRLKDNLDPPEPDSWHMPVNDFFLSESAPFAVVALRKAVQKELHHRAKLYADCPRWELELLNRANSYSASDATRDIWYYGKNQFQQVIDEIIEEVTNLPCGNQ